MRPIDADVLAEIFIDRMEKVKERFGFNSSEAGILSGAYKLLQSQPTIEPERKTGKWKGYNANNPKWLRDDGNPVFLECSACNTIVMNNGSAYWNFCPNCGADMRGKQDEKCG